jgi:sulfate transport system ATP-binding protein
MSIHVQGLTKKFGDFRAVDDVSFQLEAGSLSALLGPSGSGKSTLLRMIAGLETPDAGQIRLTGAEATAQSARDETWGLSFNITRSSNT